MKPLALAVMLLAAVAAATPQPPSVSGTWNWVSGQTLEVFPGGTLSVYQGSNKINEGRWERLGGNRFRFVHINGGFIDTVSLSADGNSLDGGNHSGNTLHGTRRTTSGP